jgi:hypothetical protein
MLPPCPPPHMVWHEPLDDKATRQCWDEYRCTYSAQLDIHEIDAAKVYSVEEFSKQFEIWVTTKSSKRAKLLLVWHAHFLSLACQQTLRRWLETKSYRCRVWFHAELLNNVQSAILSRCILRYIPGVQHTIRDVTVVGDSTVYRSTWAAIHSENELKEKASKLLTHA